MSEPLTAEVRAVSLPLRGPGDLDPLLDRIGDSRYVLLGEASHGTSEFYTWRTEISRRLIAEKGFSFIAVEGDWPDCFRVNRHVRGMDDAGATARDVLRGFHALAELDVGERGDRRPRELAARITTNAGPENKGSGFTGWTSIASGNRSTRSWSISTATTPAAFRPRGGRSNASSRTARTSSEYARATGFVRQLVRGRGRVALAETPRTAPSSRRSARGSILRRARTPSYSRTPRPTTARWSGAGPRPGTCATGTWPRRSIG